MTFPYSNHNYQLRFWMAAGGVDPDEDVRLVVLPPPYMVESLAKGHVDGFCVGAPWNSLAVDLGIGRILHFGTEIIARAAEKVLAVRSPWADEQPDALARLLRAHERAARFVADPVNRGEVAGLVAAPNRVGVTSELILRTLDGRLRVARDGPVREDPGYLLIGREGAARPDPVQAAWSYAQMVRWGQAPLAPDLLAAAQAVFCPGPYDAAVGSPEAPHVLPHGDGIGAFTGPLFEPTDIAPQLQGQTDRDPL